MKILEMSDDQLIEALSYMEKVPIEDPNFSGWNFDEDCWKDKKQELLDEKDRRIN